MLTVAYVALALLGCGYVLVGALLGQLTDGADGGGDAGGGDHGGAGDYGIDGSGHGSVSAGGTATPAFHFPLFSPLALATLVGAVGAFGLITRAGLGMSDGASLAVAIPAGLATSYAASWASWRFILSATGTSAISAHGLNGARGEVLTPIPSGGVGEVAALVSGQRYTGPARTEDGSPLDRGAAVRVVRVVGSTLMVQADRETA